MSYMEVYAVRSNGDVEFYDEAHNAFGGAMHIWMALKEKYHIQAGFSEEGFKKIWDSIGKMNEPDQWVMASTFDHVLISKGWLPKLLQHWKEFATRYPTDTLQSGIAILDRAIHDREVEGIGFNHTSVVEPFWLVPIEDEEEESRPYNINSNTGHWFLTPGSPVFKKK